MNVQMPTQDTGTMQNGHARQLFASFVCGAMTGAALGLLFAPAKGREARAYLATKATAGRARASKVIEQGQETFKRQAGRVSSVASRARTALKREGDHAKRAVSEGREALADISQRGQRAYESVRSEVRDAIRDVRGA